MVIRFKGFTILELLLAVMIVLLASTLGAFYVYRELDRIAVRSGGQDLMHMARYGRLLAGEKQLPCRLHINLDEGRYWLTSQKVGIPVDAETDSKVSEPETVQDIFQRPRQLPGEVRFIKAQVAGDEPSESGEVEIAFRLDGSSDAALIQMGIGEIINTVVVYPWSGRAELKKGEITELPSRTIDR